MNTLTEDELKELARKAIKAGDDERREITRAVVNYLGGEKITEAPVKHWPLLQAMFEHWIKADNPLLTAVAEPEPQADETPLDHFGQPANDNDGVPQTSKDAYAEIARSLGHAVIAHVDAGDYEQALKCAALMRRAEMEPVEALKVTVNMDQGKRDEIADLMRHMPRFGHTGGIIGEKPWAKTMLVMPDGFAAYVAKRTFKDSPDVRVVTPTAAEISSRTARTIIVHPGVDLDQEIEGQGRLRDLLIKRQQTFGADARLLTLGGSLR